MIMILGGQIRGQILRRQRISRIHIFSRLSSTMTTLFAAVVPPGVVNLRMGAPGDGILLRSAERVKDATEKIMTSSSATSWLTYGAELGAGEFRDELAKFLSTEYRMPVDRDSIIQTAGATNGLYMLASLTFGPGDLVFTERLSYFLAINVLRDGLRYNVKSVDIDSGGICPVALERALESHSDDFKRWNETRPRPYWAMLYIMPTFHNPTGYCLSPDRCEKIIELARKYHLLVMCDDVYNVLYFPRQYPDGPPKRLFAYDNRSDPAYQGNVVSIGTFSKLFGPGVRLGWLEVPQKVNEVFKKSFALQSGGALNHMTSGILTSIMKDGYLSELVDSARKINEERCEVMCSTLKSVSPSVKIDDPKGGYFLWVRLPDGFPFTAEEFTSRCLKDAKIGVFPGKISSPSPIPEDSKYFRISFAYYEKEELQSCITKLGKFINQCMQ